MSDDIIRYVDNEMTDDEASVFEDALKQDAELMENYKSVLAAKKLSAHWIDAEIKGYLHNIKPETKDVVLKRNYRKYWWIILIGVILLSILGVGFWQSQNETKPTKTDEKSLYAMHYEEPIWPIIRGDENVVSRAVILHLDGKTDAAIQLLTSDSIMTNENKYWAAEILVHADRCGEAKVYLEKLEKFDDDQQRIYFLKKYCDTR